MSFGAINLVQNHRPIRALKRPSFAGGMFGFVDVQVDERSSYLKVGAALTEPWCLRNT